MVARREGNMGSERKGFFLMFLTCLYTFACSSSLHKALPSDSLQEINLEDKNTYIHGTGDNYVGGNRRRGIVQSSKIARGSGGANGGRSTGSGENGGESTGSTQNGNSGAQGGAAVIPVYAAGAANKPHQNSHHSSGSCSWNCVGLPTMIMSSASLAFNFYIG